MARPKPAPRLRFRSLVLSVMSVIPAAVLAVLPGGCAPAGPSTYGRDKVAEVAGAEARPDRLVYCHGHGCARRSELLLSTADWRAVGAAFDPLPRDAAGERAALARAAAAFERLAGPRTGTTGDRGGSFHAWGEPGQLDCIDEAVNMTQLARLLAARGLLRHHGVGDPVRRGNFLDAWPHFAASLQDLGDGRRWVLDAWYFDSGQQVLLLPYERWLAGLEQGDLACLERAGDMQGCLGP